MNTFKINQEEISDVLNTTDYIIKAFGPRLAGSNACINAAVYIKNEYKKYCDTVSENDYIQYPSAFFYMPSILALSYLIGVFFFFIPNLIWLSTLVLTFGIIFLITQFVYFSDSFNNLFKQKAGKNVFGIIEPRGKLKQQIIISAHHDSPYICNFLTSYQKLYPFRIFIPMIIYLYVFVSAICFPVLNLPKENSTYYSATVIIIFIGCIFVFPMFWYNSRKGSPGAGDNLLSSVIGIKLAEIIKKNDSRLEHTRLIILSNDGEEIGMKGARAFIRQNKKLLDECKTYVLNLDSIYNYDDLTLFTSDRNGTINLSENLTNEIIEISNQSGYSIKKKKFPFGGGGTDAGRFAEAGIEAASIVGLATNMIRDGLYYHTANDVVENLDPKAIEAVLNIVMNFVITKDLNSYKIF